MAKIGAPRKYKTREELEEAVEDYISQNETLTLTGLALSLGFESRQSIYDNEKNGEFSYTIKRARLRIENSNEKLLYSNATAGAIYALKNFGWTDKQHIEHSGDSENPVRVYMPDNNR